MEPAMEPTAEPSLAEWINPERPDPIPMADKRRGGVTIRPETLAKYSKDTRAPFRCKECPKGSRGFDTARGLMTHVQNVHMGVLRRNYRTQGTHKCPRCFRTFSSRKNMGNHVRREHGISMRDVPNKPNPITRMLPRPVGRPKGSKDKPRRWAEPMAQLNHEVEDVMSRLRPLTPYPPRIPAMTKRKVNFCPCCGTNIGVVQETLSFVSDDR